MCGIFCTVSAAGSDLQNIQCKCKSVQEKINPLLCRRGPDYYGEVDVWLQQSESHESSCQDECVSVAIHLAASVLHLRGDVIAQQPMKDEHGNILAWNGEIFSGLQVDEGESDTAVLLKNLHCATSDIQQILATFSSIQGPWAVVYYQARERCIWFGRDYFGRRSLLWHHPKSATDFFAISSIGTRGTEDEGEYSFWEEIPADGIYCLDLEKLGYCILGDVSQDIFLALTRYPWQCPVPESTDLTSSYGLTCPVKNIFNKQLHSCCLTTQNKPSCDILPASNLAEHSSNTLVPRDNTKFVLKHPDSACRDCENSQAAFEENSTVKYPGIESNSENIGMCSDEGASQGQDCCNLDRSMASNSSENKVDNKALNRTHIDSCNLTRDINETRKNGCSITQSHKTSECPLNKSSQPDSLDGCGEVADSANASCSNSAVHDAILSSNDEQTTRLENTVCSLSLNGRHASHCWVEQFVDILTEATRKRVYNLPRSVNRSVEYAACSRGSSEPGHEYAQFDNSSKIGILFSGGLDSIVLAALADRCVPPEEPIDLINVAFEQNRNKNETSNKRISRKHPAKSEDLAIVKNFDVPDRITGRKGVAELQTLNSKRLWNFVEVNITLEELQDARSQLITHLVFPQSTVLDDSIGCAIWFAARGQGTLKCRHCVGTGPDLSSCNHTSTYISPAKVLLVGMGADEQLGGYARHRYCFHKKGWQGLLDEMEMEVQRISKRNLGRDDRCVSDHGREGRYPYLDENVVSFLNDLPVWVKCDPRLDRGFGEKILLRQLAKFIGLTSSSDLPKRAIQFGSKIAKLEKSSEKGNEICHRL